MFGGLLCNAGAKTSDRAKLNWRGGAALILLRPPPRGTTEQPKQVTNHRKKGGGLPSLRVNKLARHDRRRNNDGRYPAHQGYRETDQVDDDPDDTNHCPVCVCSLSSERPTASGLICLSCRCHSV